MHQHFLDVRAMRLVGRRIEPELNRADDLAVELCDEQHGIARSNRARDLSKEREPVIKRERRHETDAGATLDAIDQHGSELLDRAICDRRGEDGDFDAGVHAARSSFDATVESALRR